MHLLLRNQIYRKRQYNNLLNYTFVLFFQFDIEIEHKDSMMIFHNHLLTFLY